MLFWQTTIIACYYNNHYCNLMHGADILQSALCTAAYTWRNHRTHTLLQVEDY
jgi:hypothetical protein